MFGVVPRTNEGVLEMLHENQKLAHSIKESASILGIGVTKIYQEISEGRLKARKFGKRTLVTAEALSQWLNNLPAIGEGK